MYMKFFNYTQTDEFFFNGRFLTPLRSPQTAVIPTKGGI